MWLRAKQRRDRWDEEIQQCATDMVMIQNWFKYQENLWEERIQVSMENNHAGYACYARRQKGMWGRFIEKSQVFEQYIQQYYFAQRHVY